MESRKNETPIVVYPAAYIRKLKKEREKVQEQLKNGEQLVFENIKVLFESLDKE